MRGKTLALVAGAVSLLLVGASPGAAAANKPPAPTAEVWIEALTITCPEPGVLEVTLVVDASADTTIVVAEAILTEMREVSIEDEFYPYTTSIPVADWWQTERDPLDVPLTVGFRTDDGDFDSTTWEGDKHHFWNPALTGEDPNDDAWFRARAWVEGRRSANGRPGGSWDMDEMDVYHNCLTGVSFIPTANPWEGWNHPDE